MQTHSLSAPKRNAAIWMFAVKRFGLLWAGAMTAAVALAIVFIFGPIVESQGLRVIENAQAVNAMPLAEGRVRFLLIADKRRPCELLEIRWYALYEDGTMGEIPVEARPRVLPPVGRFRDPLIVAIPRAAESHLGYYFFDCGMPWTTYAPAGPFPNWFRDLAGTP